MKLDKIKFARLIQYITECGFNGNVSSVDDFIDIDVEPVTISMNLDSLDALLAEMVRGQRKIEAIKLYRSLTGFGLKEAKDAVEKYWQSSY